MSYGVCSEKLGPLREGIPAVYPRVGGGYLDVEPFCTAVMCPAGSVVSVAVARLKPVVHVQKWSKGSHSSYAGSIGLEKPSVTAYISKTQTSRYSCRIPYYSLNYVTAYDEREEGVNRSILGPPKRSNEKHLGGDFEQTVRKPKRVTFIHPISTGLDEYIDSSQLVRFKAHVHLKLYKPTQGSLTSSARLTRRVVG
ncbi:hypothetical protein BYT27DRAFT_7215746 [Phlegmacium glaucopus]|nr:hypothetical protein BYT27DRAFT_7215746 [Phlegmacium glaucopus]